jgi:hypothetical protein
MSVQLTAAHTLRILINFASLYLHGQRVFITNRIQFKNHHHPTPCYILKSFNYLSYIYLRYFVCLCVIECVFHNCGTLCYSFSFGNQTDKGDETEGLEREG